MKRRFWTTAENTVLRATYPDLPTVTIAGAMARSLTTTYQHARKLGLCKSAAYLASPAACRLRRGDNVGAASRFPKGNVPANKGVIRGRGWAPGRMKEGQFRKGARDGQAGKNWMPVGSERDIDGYRYTKVSDKPNVPYTVNWKPIHLLGWQAVNGPLPQGMVLKCVDGDKANTDPTNWTAIPRALLPRLNGGRQGRLNYDHAPLELKPVIMAAAKLDHAARERRRGAA